MRSTRRHRTLLSIAAALATGSLTLTACGTTTDPAATDPGSPATVTSVDAAHRILADFGIENVMSNPATACLRLPVWGWA